MGISPHINGSNIYVALLLLIREFINELGSTAIFHKLPSKGLNRILDADLRGPNWIVECK